jgi:processive 1,2-diacylglycerol beta-glucosyltransferase
MKRVLVLTASFGEGHNTAARSIREALEAMGDVEVRVGDLYADAIPLVNSTVKFSYSFAINRLPWLWKVIFLGLDKPGWMESTMWATGPLRNELDEAISDFRPDVIISTYPLYAYLFRDIQKRRLGVRMPIITVITDSIGVNSAWHRCLSDAFVVADAETEQLLVSRGVPPQLIHPFGFPVAGYFNGECERLATSGPPWKLLFMPSTQLNLTLRQIRALVEVPDVQITVVAGKNVRIFDAVNASGLVDGERCKLIGWTNDMPKLLCEHHAFIGKAGGAIVQEAIAARSPFFVSHLVPGQEEGNIALIERLGVGMQALGGPSQLAAAVSEAFAENGRIWHAWKDRLARVGRPDAAERIAKFAISFPAPGAATQDLPR